METNNIPQAKILIESEIVPFGEIAVNDIKGKVPHDAEYAALNPFAEFIQKFYKFTDVKFNDGTVNKVLQYWSEQDGWYNSSFNDKDSRDYKKIKEQKFLKIIR